VCGSGVAGLVAARVLADTFDEVLLLERDAPLLADPAAAAPEPGAAAGDAAGGERGLSAELAAEVEARRRGVPQFTQPHVRPPGGSGAAGRRSCYAVDGGPARLHEPAGSCSAGRHALPSSLSPRPPKVMLTKGLQELEKLFPGGALGGGE
jgi:hypothetical protein